MSLVYNKTRRLDGSSFSIHGPSSEEELITWHLCERKNASLCKACGEPISRYGYCDDCYTEIKYRVEKLKIRIEQDSTKMYKDEYVVIDLSKLN